MKENDYRVTITLTGPDETKITEQEIALREPAEHLYSALVGALNRQIPFNSSYAGELPRMAVRGRAGGDSESALPPRLTAALEMVEQTLAARYAPRSGAPNLEVGNLLFATRVALGKEEIPREFRKDGGGLSHRDLLRKYMQFLLDVEGSTLMHRRGEVPNGIEFTDEEWAALERIEQELSA